MHKDTIVNKHHKSTPMKKTTILLVAALTIFSCSTDDKGTGTGEEDKAVECLERGSELNGKELYDSAAAILHEGLAHEGAADSTKGMLCAELSVTYNMQGDMKKAMAYGQRALQLCRGNIDAGTFVILSGNTGIVYRRLGLNDSAAACYKNGVEVALRHGDDEGLAYLYNNLSVLYYEMERHDEGLEYAVKARMSAKKAGDSIEYYSAMANEGIGYARKGEYKRAATLLKTVFDKAENMNSTPLKLKVANYLPSALNSMHDYKSAALYIEKGEKAAAGFPQASVAATGIKEAKMTLLMATGRYKEALAVSKQLESMQNMLAMPAFKLRMMQAACHAGTGDHRRAYEAAKEAAALRDSMHSHNVEKQLSEYSIRFKTQEKELELSRLQQERSEERSRMMTAVAVLAMAAAMLATVALRATHRRKMHAKQAEIDMARKYIEGVDGERARLARELHDGACNDLLSVGMELRAGSKSGEDIITHVAEIRTSLRRISHELMPPSFRHATIDEIVAHYLSHLAKPGNMSISHNIEGEGWEDVPHDVAYQMYRIMQEAVSNVIQHSSATRATVTLTCNGRGISLQVTDNGKGCGAPGAQGRGKGIGAMRDRASSIGATFEYTSGKNGTHVETSLPDYRQP